MPSQAHLFLPLPNTQCVLYPHFLISIRLDPTHAEQRVPSAPNDQHPVLLQEHLAACDARERATRQLRPIENAERVTDNMRPKEAATSKWFDTG